MGVLIIECMSFLKILQFCNVIFPNSLFYAERYYIYFEFTNLQILEFNKYNI